MDPLPVSRWLFWAGVLVLVATLALSAVYGQQSNPPYGTSWDFVPLLVTIAVILLLTAVVSGGRAHPSPPSDAPTTGDPPP